MKNILVARWQLLLGSVGIMALMLACMAVGVGTNPTATTQDSEEVAFQLEDGIIKVQDENGDWTPVSGDSFFDLTAELESIDPWSLAGITLEISELTQIEEGLQTGELVQAQGFILEDGTWLANSIKSAKERVDPIIILIGIVDSVDPWVVNGIELNVTEDTEIQGAIAPGTFVRVEILLLPDGSWEVLSIVPLGEPDDDTDCATVLVTVVGIEGDEIQLSGWPAITLGEDVKIEGGIEALSTNQVVLIAICPSEEGQVIIVQIIVQDTGDEGTSSDGGEKVLVCHKPDKKGGHTLSISSSAVPAHLAHGDTLGPCP